METPYEFKNENINEAALAQRVFWYNSEGKLFRIREMHPKHANNASRKLYGQFGEPAVFSPLYRALVMQGASR